MLLHILENFCVVSVIWHLFVFTFCPKHSGEECVLSSHHREYWYCWLFSFDKQTYLPCAGTDYIHLAEICDKTAYYAVENKSHLSWRKALSQFRKPNSWSDLSMPIHSRSVGYIASSTIWENAYTLYTCECQYLIKDIVSNTINTLWVLAYYDLFVAKGLFCRATILPQIAKFMGPTWAHLGPVGPKWSPCWPHAPCYQGRLFYMKHPALNQTINA